MDLSSRAVGRLHERVGPQRTESSLAREYREHSTFPLERVEYDA